MRCRVLGLLLLSAPALAESVALAPAVEEAAAIDVTAWTARVLQGPRAAAIAADVAVAAAAASAAGLWSNPALRAERQSGPLADQTRGSQDFIVVEVPLSPGGHRGLERQAAGERAEATRLEARHARAALVRAAWLSYIDVVTARRHREALAGERAELLAAVETARRQATAGEAPASRALRLELELARLDDELAAASAEEATTRLEAAALVDGTVPPFIDVLPSSASLASSSATNARLEALARRGAAAATDEAAAARRVVPDVVVSAGPSLLQTGAPDMGVGYLVSLEVGLPVFDHGQGDVGRARAEQMALQAETSAASRQLDVQRDAAAARRHSVSERASAFGVAVERARALKAAATSDLAVGSGDVVAFVDTMRALRAAQQHLIALEGDAARADVDHAFVRGAFDGPPELP